ncbi:MAG: hypothetical protein ABDH16_04295 [Thermodesulfovibrionaceae bacterium]
MIEISEELIARLNELKRYVFFEILELAGRVFTVVDYDETVIIGKRGFLPEEKERGLVLVFNRRMNLNWQDNVLTATLIFNNNPERCYIPVNFIATVFSPDLRIQFTAPVLKNTKKETTVEKNTKEAKIINITDLKKKK